MIKASVAYVLCRIEDDSSLTPVSEHQDILTGIAAGGYAVEVEDLRLRPLRRRSLQRVVHVRGILPRGQDRLPPLGNEEWPYQPQRRGSLRPRCRRVDGMISWLLQDGVPTRSVPACDALRGVSTTCSVVGGWPASGARALLGWWFTSTPSKSTLTVAQRVIHYFGPEPRQWGSGSYVLGVGAGRGKSWSCC